MYSYSIKKTIRIKINRSSLEKVKKLKNNTTFNLFIYTLYCDIISFIILFLLLLLYKN